MLTNFQFLSFIFAVIVISLSGVMFPGPTFAGTIAKGCNDKFAGMKIAVGHGIIEIPLITLLFFGFAEFFKNNFVKIFIGIVGGAILLYIGFNMIRLRNNLKFGNACLPYNSITVGILTTISNPYFFLWWATIGLTLILIATSFGIFAVVLFAVVHWSCDFLFDSFVSYSIFKSRKFWTEKTYSYVFGICGVIILIFGVWFIATSLGV